MAQAQADPRVFAACSSLACTRGNGFAIGGRLRAGLPKFDGDAGLAYLAITGKVVGNADQGNDPIRYGRLGNDEVVRKIGLTTESWKQADFDEITGLAGFKNSLADFYPVILFRTVCLFVSASKRAVGRNEVWGA